MRPASGTASAPRQGRRPRSIDRLNKEINAALVDPKVHKLLTDLGGTIMAGSPAEFGELVADETEKWAKVVKFSGAKPE